MRVNHNIPALNAWRIGTSINSSISKSLERLSSGLRINRAADDAAGLAISEKMRAQISGLNQATRNAQDGISMIQTAEGALNETHSILQRMRELSVQAANDTYTSTDRAEIQKEINQLVEEIDRISATTEFNNKKLLDGSTSALVSSDKLTTRIFMRDGLRVLDQFGQKAPGGGNFKLDIEATAGTNEVQKTDIFKIKHAGSSAEVTEDQNGVTGADSKWSIDLSGKEEIATSGQTFRISFQVGTSASTITTENIVFTASAATVRSSIATKLAALTAYGTADFTVAGTSLATLSVEFIGDLAGKDINNLQVIAGTGSAAMTMAATQGVAYLTLTARLGTEVTAMGTGSSAVTIQAIGTSAATAIYVQFMAATAQETYMADPNTLVVLLGPATAGISATNLAILIGDALSAAYTGGYKVTAGDTGTAIFTATAVTTATVTVNKGFEGGNVISITRNSAGVTTPAVNVSLIANTAGATATTSWFDSASYTVYVSLGTVIATAGASAGASVQLSISSNDLASAVQSALNSVSSTIGSYTVALVYTSSVSFLGAVYIAGGTAPISGYAGDSQSQDVVGGTNAVSQTETIVGSADVNEIQNIAVEGATAGTFTLTHVVSEVQELDVAGATSGTFTLTVGTGTTTAIAYNAEASSVQTALEGLSSVGTGNVTVEEIGDGSFRIRFAATAGATGMTVSSTLTGATAALTLSTAYSSEETDAIAYNAAASAVRSALEGLASIGTGDVTVTMSGDSWQVEFAGNLAGTEQNALVIDGTSLEKAIGEIGDIASGNSKLYDIDRFWDASGNFILQTPQTITLVQGDGKQSTFTLSEADTINDVVEKLNTAIGVGLGQLDVDALDSTTDASRFVSYVETADSDGLEALEGTFVIRSAIAGNEGKITFVGDDATINALSLTTIQAARNNYYTVDVTDVHTGDVVAEDVRLAENKLIGIVHANVDVQFASNEGVKVEWDATEKNFSFTGGSANATATFVHLADRTSVFHIGANQKQDIGMGIGNMGSYALGINGLQITSNSLANQAIGKLDNAIGTVSSERSKLGALQNRLEHTINNLGVTIENVTAAESRIRDADMAKEIMEFTKLQILMQSSNSMLAQANQLPQNVLQLLR